MEGCQTSARPSPGQNQINLNKMAPVLSSSSLGSTRQLPTLADGAEAVQRGDDEREGLGLSLPHCRVSICAHQRLEKQEKSRARAAGTHATSLVCNAAHLRCG